MNNLENVFNGNNLTIIMFIASFLGGVISSISPCTLGILPLIIGYTGISENENIKKTLIRIFFLILGLSTIMVTMGLFSALGGKIFVSVFGKYWILFIASLIMIFGLNILGLIEINYGNLIKKMPKNISKNVYLHSYIIGLLFALASTPCSTPVLAGILSYASITKNILISAFMLFLFSIGQGLILMLAALFTTFIKNTAKLRPLFLFLYKLSGILLVILSIYIFWNILFN